MHHKMHKIFILCINKYRHIYVQLDMHTYISCDLLLLPLALNFLAECVLMEEQ